MKVVDSVTTVEISDVWGPKKYPPSGTFHGPFYPPPHPTSEPVSFNEIELMSWVKPSEKPPISWAESKRSGSIRMTSYEALRHETHNFAAGRTDCSANFYLTSSYSSGTSGTCFGSEEVILRHVWREQGDLRYWSDKVGLTVHSEVSDASTAEAIASTRTAAIASFKGGYDFLTEMAEARQGAQFFKETSSSVYGIFQKFFANHGNDVIRHQSKGGKTTARDMLRSTDRGVRRAGSAWLAYRYAIMPLYYSYMDVKELIERSGNHYQTYRSRDEIRLDPPDLSGAINGLHQYAHGTRKVVSVVKAGYSNDFLRSFVSNQVQTNPFATAWELVPLSFVLDWFVNVGDFIVASTSADLSLKSAGCTSIKTEMNVQTVLKHTSAKELSKSFTQSNPCLKGTRTLKYSFATSTEEICQNVVINHILRVPFDVNDAALSFNPSLNWKRVIDGVALSHSPLKKLYKRFFK